MPQEQGTRESREECVARMLRSGASWSTIEEECGVSRSTISRIKNRIEGGDKGAAGSVLWDAELAAKAIKLIKEGKARTPADLVEQLGIPVPQATELFNAAATAMRMTIYDIVELSRKLDKMKNEASNLIRELGERIREVSNANEKLSNVIPILLEKEKALEDVVKKADSELRELNRLLNSEKLEEAKKIGVEAVNLYYMLLDSSATLTIIGLTKAVTCEHFDLFTRQCEVRKHIIGLGQMVGGDLYPAEGIHRVIDLATDVAVCAYCPYYKQRSLESLIELSKQAQARKQSSGR